MQTARELAEQLIPLAQRTQDSVRLQEAHFSLGTVLYATGEWVSARAHYEQAIALSGPQQRRSVIARDEMDFGAFSLPYLATILWWLGYPDQALAGVVRG